MSYKDYYIMYKRRILIIINLLYSNLAVLFIGILISSIHLKNKMIAIAIISLLSFFIIKIFKQKKQENLQSQKEIINDFGEMEILYHSGSFSNKSYIGNSIIIQGIFALYAILVFVIMVVTYNLFLEDSHLILKLGICHAILFAVLIIFIRSIIRFRYIFTKSHLIIDNKKCIKYGKISKFQSIKLMEKGYLIDINTGERFIRLNVDDDKKKEIQNLLVNS